MSEAAAGELSTVLGTLAGSEQALGKAQPSPLWVEKHVWAELGEGSTGDKGPSQRQAWAQCGAGPGQVNSLEGVADKGGGTRRGSTLPPTEPPSLGTISPGALGCTLPSVCLYLPLQKWPTLSASWAAAWWPGTASRCPSPSPGTSASCSAHARPTVSCCRPSPGGAALSPCR